MKTLNKSLFLGLVSILILGFASCEELDKRTVFPHSTPVIESATINPNNFIYGDSLTLNVKVSDPNTPLSTIEMKAVVNDKVIANGTYKTRGNNDNISAKFATNFLSQLPDNEEIDIFLTLKNSENDKTESKISNVIGKRRTFNILYLVLEDGRTFELKAISGKQYKYATTNNLSLPNSIKYLVAEKLTADKKIDYSGFVWGGLGNEIIVAGVNSKFITTTEAKKKNTVEVIFDAYNFTTHLIGEDLEEITYLDMSMFKTEVKAQKNEIFKEGSFILTKGQKIELKGEFGSTDILFNVDYFDRIAVDIVQYLGETGPMTLDYNPMRKMVLVQDPNPNYPTSLFISGDNIGYPSKINNMVTTGWGFDNVTKFISFRKTENGVYQGTVYLQGNPDGTGGANFKPFLQRDWGNEIKSTEYIMNDVIVNDKALGENNGNWYAKPGSESGIYRITININKKEVDVVPFTLP